MKTLANSTNMATAGVATPGTNRLGGGAGAGNIEVSRHSGGAGVIVR